LSTEVDTDNPSLLVLGEILEKNVLLVNGWKLRSLAIVLIILPAKYFGLRTIGFNTTSEGLNTSPIKVINTSGRSGLVSNTYFRPEFWNFVAHALDNSVCLEIMKTIISVSCPLNARRLENRLSSSISPE
jgi:hypothetical protein